MNKFYITTPIYYANAKPHIGHAYTTVAADVLARFHRLQNEEVFLLAGTDEHGMKIQKKAEELGKDPQKFVDEIAEEYKKLWKELNIKYDGFIRTTDPKHKEAVQKVLQILFDKGAIYKGEYEGLYCTDCEQFKSENELIDGKCPDHNKIPEMTKEECYLLKMKDKQSELIEKIKSNEFEIAPQRYKNEILSFLESQELKDISISRKNVKWGIELPFDPAHTTYVWADAFLNYLTGIGYNGEKFQSHVAGGDGFTWWPADVQLIGKDILRVHATIWPIMLMQLGIKLPKLIFTHGHILSGGKKMSKTVGNAISIEEMLEKFGTDGTRYLLLSAGTFGEDVDVTMERLIANYNSGLANGLGNLTSRIVTLYQKIDEVFELKAYKNISGFSEEKIEWFDKLEFNKILDLIFLDVSILDKYIENNKPWENAKNNKEEFHFNMDYLIEGLNKISQQLSFFMPDTSIKINDALKNKKVPILFPRIK